MQNNILQKTLTDNSADSYMVINPTNQQVTFFPKEESQMFTSKESSFTGARPEGNVNDPENESENKDTLAFIDRIKNPNVTQDYTDYYGSVPGGANTDQYKYNFENVSSSHTETNYIGATSTDIPAIINETFATFALYNLALDATTSLFVTSDTSAKLRSIATGVQAVRIPQNTFNTILTDETAIINNNNSPLIKNFGLYYIIVSPNYVKTTVGNILNRVQYDWLNMYLNGTMSYSGTTNLFSITPGNQRRTVYECSKTDFQNLPWDFEASGLQSGRLYGSVVEVWDSGETTLKQVKLMMENEFNFSNSAQTHFTLYPDNVGYDAPGQKIVTGDVLHIYPRETYFNQIVIEINYQDSAQQLQNLLAFMMNDATRDITTGVYQIYDSAGFTIDSSGNFNGNTILSFQLFSTGKVEARKILTPQAGSM